MLNNLILVGRLTKDIEVKKTTNGLKVGTLCLAIPRSFKNMEGVYETDFIYCTLWEEKAKIASQYCHKGDVIGIRGRIQSKIIETENGKKYGMEVVAEKLTFLSSSKPKEQIEKKEEALANQLVNS